MLFFLLFIKTQGTTLLAILLFTFIIVSFVISGAEVAIFSLSNRDINMLKTKPHPAAKRIVNLLDESNEVYTSLFIVGLLIKVLIIAFLLIFFCKILPKVWATQNNLRFAYDSSLLVQGIHFLLVTISKRMVALADRFGGTIGGNRGRSDSMRELDQAIDFTTGEETTTEEKNILKGIVKFGNTSVKQIMRSRLDVCGIEYNLPFQNLLSKVEELHYSRLPVYKTNLDEVVGVLNTKDLLAYINQENNFDWHFLLRQPFFVPETKLIEDLLKDFQTKRVHFAIVVDEFGGTSGIVTMEDVLEEIIGEIKDEFDDDETGVKKLDDFNYIFEGKIMINDACRAMKLPQDTFDKVRGESESMAGLILELAGEFPATKTVIPCGDFDFTVLDSFKNRILQLKVTIKPKLEKE
jgi:gliding motility-associated protein GldE